MRRIAAVVLVAAAIAVPASADPATALREGRALIQSGNYAAAVETFRNAMSEAAKLPRASERAAALSALHFYSAVALTEAGNTADAEEAIRAFLSYRPEATIEGSQYSKTFVRTYDRVRREFRKRNRGAFQDYYPGIAFVDATEPPVNNVWGASTAFLLLATDEERNEWANLREQADQERFVAEFWRRRDLDPSTEYNEFRADVLRRIAFADRIFGDEATDRGSMTDRGKVYVLLGPPFRVVIRPLNQQEAIFQPQRRARSRGVTAPPSLAPAGRQGAPSAGEGAVEEWVYRREQLVAKIPTHEVEFRFVADAGGGVDRTLQRTFQAMTALGIAKTRFSGEDEAGH